MGLLTVSGSPHIHTDQSVPKIMYGVVIAMIPAMLVSFYFFGLDAAKVTLVSVLACLFFEWVVQKPLSQEYCLHLTSPATFLSG
jgi:electron transport complex protein RnfD